MTDIDLKGTLTPKQNLQGTVNNPEKIHERDYEKLDNKPSINRHVLIKDTSLETLGVNDLVNEEVQALSNLDIDEILRGVF